MLHSDLHNQDANLITFQIIAYYKRLADKDNIYILTLIEIRTKLNRYEICITSQKTRDKEINRVLRRI